MSVVIDEVVQENPVETVPDGYYQTANQPTEGSGQQPDMDRMTFEYRRRHHRLERLWAD